MTPLAITIGDAAGVGPELILSAGRALRADGPVVAYGSAALLAHALDSLRGRYGAAERFDAVARVDTPTDALALPADTLAVIDAAPHGLSDGEAYPWGQARAAFGVLQDAALRAAVGDAMSGQIRGILTAPWHKARLRDAGLPPTGHTEVLQEASGARRAVMVLAGDVLRVALVTIHVPLREVATQLTTESIIETTTIVAHGLRDSWGIGSPRIALCGLNPHAGEDGVLGDEDTNIIVPAIAALQAAGIDATGPYPADTLFPRVVAGLQQADAVVAMYHDQGLVPLKTVHFTEAANITLGLPFVRTSPDHGTAYDIAGSGAVDAGSFLYAGRLARRMVAVRDG